jgi:hypothetical protein
MVEPTPVRNIGSSPEGPDDHMPTVLGERLAKLEGSFDGLKIAIEGLRHSQNMTLTAVLGVGVILAAIGIYVLQCIDALPTEFERLNQTLSSAITASKQQQPQVILIPTPPPQQPSPQLPNNPK